MKIFLNFALALAFLCVFRLPSSLALSTRVEAAAPRPEVRAVFGKVVKVFDGDSLLVTVNGRPMEIRLIGVDTPEKNESDKLYRDSLSSHQNVQTIRHLGKEAARITERLVKGKTVRLEFDQEQTDRYHRTLAYVFFLMPEKEFAKKMGLKTKPPDGDEQEFLLNRVLIEYGYALAYRKFSYRYKEEFLRLEKAAQKKQLGLWKPDKKNRALQDLPEPERIRKNPASNYDPLRRIEK